MLTPSTYSKYFYGEMRNIDSFINKKVSIFNVSPPGTSHHFCRLLSSAYVFR